MKWRPIETYKAGKYALVYAYPSIFIGDWKGDKWVVADVEDWTITPTHWMPLPSPPGPKP